MSLTSLKTKRGVIRGFFTRLNTFLATTTDFNEAKLIDLKTRFEKCDEQYGEFLEIQAQIDAASGESEDKEVEDFETKYFETVTKIKIILKKEDLSNTKEKTVTHTIDGIENQIQKLQLFVSGGYNDNIAELEHRLLKLETQWSHFERSGEANSRADSDRVEGAYFKVYGEAKTIISSIQMGPRSNGGVQGHGSQGVQNLIHNNVKLQGITLPQFGGNYSEWLQFKDMFISLVHNSNLPTSQKFHYLKVSLVKEAGSIIASLETTDANYDEAWNLIIDRFENRRLIIHSHVRALFDLQPIAKESYTELQELVDKVQKHLRALKSLNQSTESCDAVVMHLISTKLDNQTRREWEQQNQTNEPSTLKEMLKFLNGRCNLLETVIQQNPSFKSDFKSNQFINNKKPQFRGQSSSHAAAQQQLSGCRVCNANHPIYYCEVFKKMSIKEREDEIRRLRLCLNCLGPGHSYNNCQSRTCSFCDKKHNTMLHYPNKVSHHQMIRDNQTEESGEQVTQCNLAVGTQVLLSTAIVHAFDNRGRPHELRALLDSGSQSNFITVEASKLLNLKLWKTSFSVSGINERVTQIHERTTVKVKSRFSPFSADLSCLVLAKITENLPFSSIRVEHLNVPADLRLADPEFNISRKIDMLIGADLFFELLCIGKIASSRQGPTFQKTHFGWIVSGRFSVPNEYGQSNRRSCNVNLLEVQMRKFWEMEEHFQADNRSREERECEDHFTKTYKRDADGRFIVRLPIVEHDPLGNSYDEALRRFKSTERRFKKDEALRINYTDVIHEYIESGHMQLASLIGANQSIESFYSPHHPVFRDSKTTSTRVVFDGSARTTSGQSLNDIMLVGPTIQHSLIAILLRFRNHRFVLTGDISKMYRQIWVSENDRRYQRILWRDDPSQEVRVYQLNTVTFGTASAPYLAIRSLQQIAHDEGADFPLAKPVILEDFYVDDVITGGETVEQLIRVREELTKCLGRGGFPLRKWASNSAAVLPESQDSDDQSCLINLDKQGETKALGLHWNCKSDLLKYSVSDPESHKITKRQILSTISKLYDPLGLIGPILVTAKIIMQKLWCLKINWDESVPTEIYTTWSKFIKELTNLRALRIPRKVVAEQPVGVVEIHGFCDASQEAFGGCIYIRTVDLNGVVTVRLLCAKSRVAPIKTVSLPRLELCGAVVLSQLFEQVQSALQARFDQYYLWSDSTIVLSWLNAAPNTWKTFVANRASEIQSKTDPSRWFHVDTANNPADIISRGALPRDLIKSNLWWNGPQYLYHDKDQWPDQFKVRGSKQENEERKMCVIAMPTVTDESLKILERYSSFNKLIRVIGYCLRFIDNSKSSVDLKNFSSNLDCTELRRAELKIISMVQRMSFAGELKALTESGAVGKESRLLSLHPFLDPLGLIRVGGRLSNNVSLSFDQKHQILLPGSHSITKLIIKREHERNMHASCQATLAALRQAYWPISGRNAVRHVLQRCIKCFKVKPKLMSQFMGELPRERSEISRPFLNTGVDYAGPISLKEGRGRGKRTVKGYIAVFVCLATKAIHLELVQDLTTESFLNCLKRFISRRGHVSQMFSDNATNFVGAANELKLLFEGASFKTTIEANLASRRITWKFIPPRSPHFGGLWEAGVKAVKSHLAKVLGDASVTYEEMYTLLTCVEACLNSRPLVPLTNDPLDLVALTPGHFLIGDSITAPIEADLRDVPINRLSRWQRIEQLKQNFWQRWAKEYVPTLQQRTKWKVNFTNLCQPDTLVIIHDDNLPPLRWKLGRIIQTHPGPDGIIRVVTIRTATGVLKRAITKICALPVE